MNTNIRNMSLRLLAVAITLGLTFVAIALATGRASAHGGSGSSDRGELSFRTEMTGDQEAPSVATDMSGRARVEVDEDMTQADFRVRVREGIAVTQSHLHCAPAGENGPVIVSLFGGVSSGINVDGDLARSTLTDADILAAGESCVMPVHDIASLTDAIRAGIIYVNVHSVANPGGEIRGQLMAD